MINAESGTKAKYPEVHIRDAVASGGPGLVIFAIIVAAQLAAGALGVVLWLIKTLCAIV